MSVFRGSVQISCGLFVALRLCFSTFALVERVDPRAVVPLGDDAGQVHDQRVEQHDPDDKRRLAKARHAYF